jgi:peroxiredoxin
MTQSVQHCPSGNCRTEPQTAGADPMARLARDPIVRAVLQQQCLVAGEFAPDFGGEVAGGAAIDLERLLESGPVVLHFDHGRWCGICRSELKALAQAWQQSQPKNASLVVVRMVLQGTEPLEVDTMPYRLLPDTGGHIASLYGLLIHVPASIAVQMAPICELPDVSGSGDSGYTVPATIVINRNGIADLCQIDPDHSLGRSGATTLACLRALLSKD